MSLDDEIRHFHEVEDQHTKYLFSKFFSKDKVATIEKPSETPLELWFKGLEKWGYQWSMRDYELRRTK